MDRRRASIILGAVGASAADDQGQPKTSELGDLHREYARWLERVVRRRGASDTAEDIVQETFLRASVYDPEALLRHPKALLLKIARSVVLNAARDAKRKKRDPTGYDPQVWQGADQYQQILLAETIAAIPEPYRDTFVLNRFEGMTYVEVAEAQGITVKVVEWRIGRALAICAERLRD